MTSKHPTFFHRNRLKIVGFFLVALYLAVCPCCMTMRTSPGSARTFFNTAKVNYKDTVVLIGKLRADTRQTTWIKIKKPL